MSAWEQQTENGESTKAYESFVSYRDMGIGRSLLKVWRQQSGNETATSVPGKITAWSEQFDWLSRARAYDAHLELTVRKQNEAAHVAELTAYRERSRKAAETTFTIANAALQLAGQKLQQMVKDKTDVPVAALPAYLRAAAAVMESSLNAEAEAIGVRRLESLLDHADEDTEPD